ncbi:MAG: GTP cyclohydrolase II [Acidobacteria bacterium]|jgi:3,4-dihydroxy 2-butanone 4-phosphate synthase/GTP cyclohydrolase II|nr:MAG: GTP cyclohydrolase II [Acidobacteriota bacterium]GIU81781.1 MAG: hypothetical protein KatS3mg006_0845 [Pyrinomonadaceae bacterium]
MQTEILSYREEKPNLEIKTVEKVAEARLPTEFGDFQIAGYRSLTSDEEFIALFKGEFDEKMPVPVRIHSQCLTGDVFHSLKCDCGKQLRWAMERIANEGHGIIVYQYQEGRGIGIINKIRAYALQDKGADTVEANLMLGFDVDLRKYDQCVEIIKDLGAKRVKVMSNNPQKIKAMIEGGLEIVERIPIEFKPSKDSVNYLKVKKLQMGHLLNLVG